MTTLIAVYNSDGCVGRCDAKCYEATCQDCTCICGGRNHGAGKQRAIENTRAMWEQWFEDYVDKLPADEEYTCMMDVDTVFQLELFETA